MRKREEGKERAVNNLKAIAVILKNACNISTAGHYTSSQHQQGKQVSLFASVIKLWVILRPCIIFWVEMRG